MTDTTIAASPTPALYRAVWRWHFYAGLITLPFMIIIAVTGGIYLYKDEINEALYGHLRAVEAREAPTLPPSVLSAAALEAAPGTLKAYLPPAAPDRAAVVKIAPEEGEKTAVYVNPYDGAVLGQHWDAGLAGSPAMWLVRKLHSLEYVGWWGNRIIEAAAGWAVVLTITGLYLWWPRGRGVGVAWPRRTKGRSLWRDIHAVTGAYAAIFIAFLAVTGLPWSGVWGSNFYDLSYKAGIGMPDGYWGKYPTSDATVGQTLDRAPWIMEKAPMPLSQASRDGVPVGLDAIVAKAEEIGVHPGFTVNMPGGAEGVFTASVYPDDITYERVVHFDQYTGEVLFDMSLADLGALGRAAEWGISVHMGQEFGVLNQILMTLACVAIILMSVAAIVMWWKRRPAGAFGAPATPQDWRIPRAILVIALAASIFFPLVGLSLVAALAIDFLAGKAFRPKAA